MTSGFELSMDWNCLIGSSILCAVQFDVVEFLLVQLGCGYFALCLIMDYDSLDIGNGMELLDDESDLVLCNLVCLNLC